MTQLTYWVILVIHVLFTGILIPSALGKFRDWQGFVDGVVAYTIGPPALSRVFGRALPIMEMLLGIGLWWSPTRLASSLGITLLLVLFTAAITYNLRRGHRTPCFCAGTVHKTPITWGIVARNIVLMTFGLALLGGSSPLLIHPPLTGSVFLLLVLTSAGMRMLLHFIEHVISMTVGQQLPLDPVR